MVDRSLSFESSASFIFLIHDRSCSVLWSLHFRTVYRMTVSFRNQDIISNLVKLLSAAVREIVGTEDENDHDGINMIDIAEGCTGALQNMAKDRESRELIRNMNIIPAVCDLMCIDHQEKI